MALTFELPVKLPENLALLVRGYAKTFEIPEELGRIIQAYAKPAFVHWLLFKEAKEVVPKRHWKDLEQALSVPDASKVCEALKVYIEVRRRLALADREIEDYRDSIGDTGTAWCAETRTVIVPNLTPEQLTERGRLSLVCYNYRCLQLKTYRALLVEIHGEEAVEYAEYLDRRRERYGWNDYGAPLTLKDWDEDDGYEDEDA
jgi:hypothetical protein